MDFKDFKKKLLQDPSFKKEYEKRDIAWEIAKVIIEARIYKGVTQEELADIMKTKQPSIARIENGNSLPSLKFLVRMADALNAQLEIPKFNFDSKHVEDKITFEGNCISTAWADYSVNGYDNEESRANVGVACVPVGICL